MCIGFGMLAARVSTLKRQLGGASEKPRPDNKTVVRRNSLVVIGISGRTK